MSITRLSSVGILLAALTLSACSTGPGADPTATPTDSATPTPTATDGPVAPPSSEEEAIDAATARIELLLQTQEEVTSAGGTDTTPYEAIAIDGALEFFEQDATRIAEGPLLNEDGESIDGQATVEGALLFEPDTAYGQEWESTPNGLVIVPGCLDSSERMITTADGKPAMQNPEPRNQVEFQVVYDADRQAWLVSSLISTGETC